MSKHTYKLLFQTAKILFQTAGALSYPASKMFELQSKYLPIILAVVALFCILWAIWDYFEAKKIKEKTTHKIVVGLVGLILILAFAYYHDFSGFRSEQEDLQRQLSAFNFKVPFYEKVPKDVDLIVHNLRIDKKEGSRIQINGPPKEDRFTVEVSNLQAKGLDKDGNQQYMVIFSVMGSLASNLIPKTPGKEAHIKIHSLYGPINATMYEFYLFIDDIDIDYIYVSVARRKIGRNISITNSAISFGSIVIKGARPEPILEKKTSL